MQVINFWRWPQETIMGDNGREKWKKISLIIELITTKDNWGLSHQGPSEGLYNVPQNCVLKTWRLGVLIHRACALVPCWSVKDCHGGVNSPGTPKHALWARVVVSSGQHISEKEAAWARAVLAYSCTQMAEAMAAWN